MPVSGRPELYAALGRGAGGFETIRETPESGWVDFKHAPYYLEKKSQKLELAKDVSAFANAQGGVIVIGIKTRRLGTERIEVADELTPVRIDMVDCGRIRDVVRQYVYPPIDELSCETWPVDESGCVLTIDVPNQDSAHKPFIVGEGLSSDGDHYGNMFGYFRRDADTAQPVPPGVVQDLMRDGNRFREWWGRGLPSALPEGSRYVATESAEAELTRLARAEEDTVAARVADEPHLLVQAWKRAGFRLTDIHGQFRSHFLRPPHVRQHGFNLDFSRDAEVLAGGGLRKTSPGWASLSVLPDGLATVVVGSEFLGWAMKQLWPQNPQLINSIALVELIFEFCSFTATYLRNDSTDSEVFLQARLRRLEANGARLLAEGAPRTGSFYGAYEARPPAEGSTEIVSDIVTDLAPPQAAFELLEGIYRNYGLPESAIPFASLEDRSINSDEFAAS